MMSILDYNNFFLVGIKGVAMTAIAQILIDAKKRVSGSDVEENFVTQDILKKLNIDILNGFETEIPKDTDYVIYTAAHNGPFNPQVIAAKKKNIPALSQAEVLAKFFNLKKGIAVCGVGGKSTVSAMIAWILEITGRNPSFSIGVGNIPGLNKTAKWDQDSDLFVSEADEYVIDPSCIERHEKIIPRFSFLKPFTTVCTNLKFDHPDVYKDFAQTKDVFFKFFNQISNNGFLILNYKDLIYNPTTCAKTILTFGNNEEADFYYDQKPGNPGSNNGSLIFNNKKYELTLKVPGMYNLENATAAIAACYSVNVSIVESINALKLFNSTQRRFELIGIKNGVTFYDDYAHHPNEILSVISALNNWYPKERKIIVFQPHTFSRTKRLLKDFIDSFKNAHEVLFLDIFSSARESLDSSISSDDIVNGIKTKFPNIQVENLGTVEKLAKHLKACLKSGDVVLTLGAGNIYKVHDLL
ncbi:MAG: UDP-N-acetylmuramate--L-alanine ligase [Pseudomonadales bacterium]|nr:UDP-N-acetylmuramate--L-alanine ligase [Pseudomonadales bacterium]